MVALTGALHIIAVMWTDVSTWLVVTWTWVAGHPAAASCVTCPLTAAAVWRALSRRRRPR